MPPIASSLRGCCRTRRTAYIHADLKEPRKILNDPVTRDVLDFGQPVALILLGILHFLQDEDKPAEIVATLLDALPPGSYLVASHIALDHAPAPVTAVTRVNQESGIRSQPRDSSEFASLAFSGLELVPPGVVLLSEWRPEGDNPRPAPAEVNFYAGVARKS